MWLNPVVLSRKKFGKLRFCVDLRLVNDLVDFNRFELPLIQRTIQSLRDQKYFSILDLEDGYLQVNLSEKDREKTTFLNGYGRLMQFKRMPQGYKNAPSVFQRGMSIVLKEFIPSKCICYIDDILIYGKTEEEHDENVKAVMNRL